jgi:hypothetical protein
MNLVRALMEISGKMARQANEGYFLISAHPEMAILRASHVSKIRQSLSGWT